MGVRVAGCGDWMLPMSWRVIAHPEVAALSKPLQLAIARIKVAVTACSSLSETLASVSNHGDCDLVVLDRARIEFGLACWVRAIRSESPTAGIIVVAGTASGEDVTRLIEAGVDEVLLSDPLNFDRFSAALDCVAARVRLRVMHRTLSAGLSQSYRLGDLVGRGPATRRLFEAALRAARSMDAVLITGETGTGKTTLARALHAQSGRAGKLVEFQCTQHASGAMEALLFGAGQSQSATRGRHPAALEAARGGTLLIENVADLPRQAQTRLLTELTSAARSPRSEHADGVWLIATSPVPLDELVKARRFCSELYRVLGTQRLEIPPLRERRREVGWIARALLERHRGLSVPAVATLDPEAVRALSAHHWPGNVRELEAVLRHAVGLARGDSISLDALPEALRAYATHTRAAGDPIDISQTLKSLCQALLASAEREYLSRVLRYYGGHVGQSATHVGCARRALQERLKKHGLRAESFREPEGSPGSTDRQLLLNFGTSAAAVSSTESRDPQPTEAGKNAGLTT